MYENFKKFTMLEDQPTTASDSTGNTDGEDTQPLLSNLAKLDKIASKEVSRWHEKSNKRLGEQLRDAEKELASIREQLREREKDIYESDRKVILLEDQLKQKEDENRELLMKWISIRDKRPEYMETCIIHTSIGFVTMAQYGGGSPHKEVFVSGQEWHIATHWMSLPIFNLNLSA